MRKIINLLVMLVLVITAEYMLGRQLSNVTDKQQQNEQQTTNPDQQNANPGQQNANPDQQNANPGQQNANPEQQNANPEQQNANPEQQPSTSPGQASSTAAVQSVTGCVVQSDHGYSLKTQNDTYQIETDKDLSQYVNKQIRITGILEHHTAAPSATSGNAAVISDIRLRTIATVVGDCNQPSK